MEIATIKIDGMNSECCADKINQALGAINGVDNVKASLSGKRASVTFNNKLVSLDQLKQAVRDAGYEIRLGHGEDGNCCGGCGG